MANTLTAVLPAIYAGLNRVSREMIGAIPAVQRDATLTRAAVGQTVSVPVVPAATGGNVTPATTAPNDGDVTPETVQVSISKSKYSPVRWSGEEQLTVGPTGQYNRILADQFAESMRWLANQVEADIILAAANGASRAYGTAGTAPFATNADLSDFAGINQILDENGAPMQGRRLIINGAARFNLEAKQSILLKVNESGGDRFLRDRVVGDVLGFGIGVTAGAVFHTRGTGASHLINNASGEAVGDNVLTVDTGSGTILAGDVITIAGDSNKYVAAGLSGTTLTLNKPGLRAAAADNAALSYVAGYTPNVAFTPDALVLAARAPAAPEGGDMADDVTFVVDPVSGIGFEVRLYREYRRVRYEVALAWGVGVVKSNHIALLLG